MRDQIFQTVQKNLKFALQAVQLAPGQYLCSGGEKITDKGTFPELVLGV